MTDRLKLYNGALLACRERELDSLSENRPARRYLDQVWNGGAVDEMLAAGQWTHATRTQRFDAETNVDPQFGYPYAFAIPNDHIRTTGFSLDEFFEDPLLSFEKGKGYWFASATPLYARYVSNDANYGNDLSKWPANFAAYGKLYLAVGIIARLSGARVSKTDLQKDMAKALTKAEATDSMELPTRFAPVGSLVRARMGGRSGGWDRGSRSRLIG